MPASSTLKPESLAAQALGWIDEATRAISPPIHTSSTYLRDPDAAPLDPGDPGSPA